MAHDPQWLRKTGRLLSTLLQAPEDGLDGFVRERLEDGTVDPSHAAAARAILVHLGEALREPTPERLMSLEHTRRMLEEYRAGVKEPVESAAAKAPRPAPAPSPAPLPAPMPPLPSGARPVIDVAPSRGPSPWAAAGEPVLPRKLSLEPDGPMNTTFDGSAASPRPVLPFVSGAAPTPQRSSFEPHPEMGQTAPLGASTAAREMASDAAPPALTLEQYAYFFIERELWPQHQAATCAKYGLDVAGESRLRARYGRAFDADAALKARFDALCGDARRQLGR